MSAFESGYEPTTLGQSFEADLAADAADAAIGTGGAAELKARLTDAPGDDVDDIVDEAFAESDRIDDAARLDAEGASAAKPQTKPPSFTMPPQGPGRSPRNADADADLAKKGEEFAELAEIDDEIDAIGTDDDPDIDEPDSHERKVAQLTAHAIADEQARRRHEEQFGMLGEPVGLRSKELETAQATRNVARLMTAQRAFHEGRTDRVELEHDDVEVETEDRHPKLRDLTMARPSANTPDGKAVRSAEKFMREHGMLDNMDF